ncbi:MAG: Ig-like domain-containing protein, partial [Acidimicrobiia bacterium]
TPVYLAMGNHEDEEGWNLDDCAGTACFSTGHANIEGRKLYFPTPSPDDAPFYTANTDPLDRELERAPDQYREDYYAFEWGDALFVVLDPFQYTMEKPYSGGPGEGSDDAFTGDQWSWTLGIQQYLWLKDILENSDSPFKFVMSHHVVGGQTASAGIGAGYVRGGATAADYFVWGGDNANGSDGWATNRPAAQGWDEPIHQMMVDAEVTAYFHGHDHQYAYEEVTGTMTGGGQHTIVYMEVPSPGMSGSGFGGIYTNDPPEFVNIGNSGHLRVEVDPGDGEATAQYVRSEAGGTGLSGTVSHTWVADAGSGNTGGGNNAPVAGNDTAQVVENGSVIIDVLDNDNDGGDGPGALSVVSVSNPPNGSATNNGDEVTYEPDSDYCGPDSFTYTVSDGEDTDIATVNVTVNCAGNTPPQALDDDATVPGGGFGDIDVLSNDTDGDGDTLTITSATNPPHGTAVNNVSYVTYTPDNVYCGPDSFTYDITDGNGGSDSAVVNVTVDCDVENHAPTANGASVTMAPNTSKSIVLTGFDADGDPLTYSIVNGPSHGDLTGSGASRTYTPDSGFTGADSFTFRIHDGTVFSNTATVSIKISDVGVPSGGTFADDNGNTHEGNIEAIAAAGITKGCNPPTNDRYCPSDDVSRGEMAAFIVRALGLSDDGGKDWFVDDNGTTFENDINRLAAAGVTRGCNPPTNNRYCPTDSVTRGAMAAFLVRALGLSDDGGKDWFIDDNGTTFENDINKLAAAGVTKGCNPPANDRYCAGDPVKRDQMASFLARALGLEPIVPPEG